MNEGEEEEDKEKKKGQHLIHFFSPIQLRPRLFNALNT